MSTSSTSSFTSSSPYSSSSSSGPLSSSSSIQLGGKGYRHKKNCKCRLCKKGGENTESSSYSDLEITSNPLTESNSNMETQSYNTVGGKRRRKTRKTKKSRKSRKSRKTKRRRH